MHTALTLNRLQHDGGSFVGHRLLQFGQVIEGHVREPGNERLIPFLHLFLTGGGQCRHRPAMNDCFIVMISNRPAPYLSCEYRRADLIAASLASAPLLQKKTWSANEWSTSICASLTCGSV